MTCGELAAADHPADRARGQGPRQLLGLDRDRPPVRGHHSQLEAGAGLLGLLAHSLQGPPRGLRGVGLDQGRVEPRQVAAHRVELRGDEDRHLPVEAPLGLLLLDDLGHPQLVLGVAIAEQQRDADALDFGVEQLGRRGPGILLAQRQHLGAEDVDAAPHPLHPIPRDQRLVVEVGGEMEAVRVGVAEVGLDPALDPQVVLLPGADDRADLEPLAREQPVEHRGAAEDPRDDAGEGLGRGRAPLLQRVLGGAHEADRLVLRRRLGLADDETARLIDDEGVCHRAAGVDRKHPRITALAELGGHRVASLSRIDWCDANRDHLRPPHRQHLARGRAARRLVATRTDGGDRRTPTVSCCSGTRSRCGACLSVSPSTRRARSSRTSVRRWPAAGS